MPKGFAESVRSFAKNLVSHVSKLVTRQERAGDAWKSFREDTRKLRHAFSGGEGKDAHGRAVHLVKKGREEYNKKRYPAAERYFRDALIEDPEYALALTYLGHALYQMGHMDDAMRAWNRAYTLEPASEAGLNAKKKLDLMKRRVNETLEQLEQRTRPK